MREHRENGPGDQPRSARRRGRRAPAAPLTDTERIAAVAAGAHVPVEEVLRDVADFRLALETDMIIAAAAVDAENTDVLSDVLDEERLELATFHDRLLTRLADAAAEDEIALRRARKAPRRRGAAVTQLVAAAASAFLMFGAARIVSAPSTTLASDPAALQNADRSYAAFSSAVSGTSGVTIDQAAADLHATIEQLINEHADDAGVAQRTAQLLQAEIALLKINNPIGADDVIARARRLATLLKRAASPHVRQSVAPVLDAAMSDEPRKPKSSASPTTKPSPTATATPKSSASASPDDDKDGNPLDTP